MRNSNRKAKGGGNEMIKIYNGDCLEVMSRFKDKSIDAIITDPPYGTTACKWDKVICFDCMWEQLKRVVKDKGAIVLFGSEPFSSALRMSNIKNYKYDWIYHKSLATGFLHAKKQPLRNHELISIFYNKQGTYNPQKTAGKPYKAKRGKTKGQSITNDPARIAGYQTINKGDRYPLTVTQKWNVETGFHPTQKPVALMEYLIKTYTNEGETVLDFTMGSGTTLVACKRTNRNGIGIEQDKKYCETAIERLKNETSHPTA